MSHFSRINIAAAIIVAAAAAPAPAQQKSQDDLRASFAEMQTHSWYVDGAWTTDFGAAKAEAAKTGKPIFAYFTRTYAP